MRTRVKVFVIEPRSLRKVSLKYNETHDDFEEGVVEKQKCLS